MVNIRDLIDEAKCFETIQTMRRPAGVTCPHCALDRVIKNGRDESQPHLQRYACYRCLQRFDDLTNTIFAGHHEPLQTWIICLYFMGLNLSSLQIAKALELSPSVSSMSEPEMALNSPGQTGTRERELISGVQRGQRKFVQPVGAALRAAGICGGAGDSAQRAGCRRRGAGGDAEGVQEHRAIPRRGSLRAPG